MLISSAAAAKDKSYQSHWRQQGQNAFSSDDNFTFSEKSRIYYSISNNNENIYLDLKIKDKTIQHQLLRSGITVWINNGASKKKKMGIRYPVRPRKSKYEQTYPRIPENSENDEGKAETDLSLVELFGFSGSSSQIIHSSKDDIRGSVTLHDPYVYYELVIPLAKLNLAGTDSQSLTFGISYNNASFDREDQWERERGEPGDFPGGAYGGMRGGSIYDMPGRYGSSSSNDQKVMWVKNVRLATSPQAQ